MWAESLAVRCRKAGVKWREGLREIGEKKGVSCAERDVDTDAELSFCAPNEED